MLSSREILDMRGALESLLPDTCHILSVTNSSDGQGGLSQTWGTVTANVSCRIDSFLSRGLASMRGGGEMVVGGALSDFSRWIVSMPYDTVVNVTDRIQMSDGGVYNIVSLDTGKSWDLEKRLTVEKV